MQALKGQLSALVGSAQGGETIVITRHGKPVAKLTPAVSGHVHVGRKVGKARLTRLFDNATDGEFLRVLLEDRYGATEE